MKLAVVASPGKLSTRLREPRITASWCERKVKLSELCGSWLAGLKKLQAVAERIIDIEAANAGVAGVPLYLQASIGAPLRKGVQMIDAEEEAARFYVDVRGQLESNCASSHPPASWAITTAAAYA